MRRLDRFAAPAAGLQSWMTFAALALSLALPAAHADLGIDARLSNASPWLREEVLLTVEVLDDRSIIEQIIAPWTPPGVVVRPLGSSQDRLQTPEGPRIRHRHLWAVMPLYPGPLELQPPTVEARISGSKRIPLSPPALRMEARPLDPLLPVDLPVSALRLTAAPLPEAVPRGRPFTWSLALEGQGLSARGIRRWLDESLRDTGTLRVHPPEVKLIERIAPESPLLQRVEARITFEPRESGTVRLPDLVLPHVDPMDGQPRLARLAGGQIAVQHPLWLAVRPWLPWAGGALLLIALAAGGRPRWQRLQRRRRWIRSLQASGDARALRHAWHAGASDENTQAARDELARLDAACYGREKMDEADFRELKARLTQKAL
ncbi:MAG TPA: hypothetical protein ENO16_02900 [Chromatiales bacterium]|mgnify:CR=1 FL=1|nr:hypothetical protein [Chromatiales bacterium]